MITVGVRAIVAGIALFIVTATPAHVNSAPKVSPFSKLTPLRITEYGNSYRLVTIAAFVYRRKANSVFDSVGMGEYSILFISETPGEKPRGFTLPVSDGQVDIFRYLTNHAFMPDSALFPNLFYKTYLHNSLRRILLQNNAMPCAGMAVFQYHPPKIEDACVPFVEAAASAIVFSIRRNKPILYVHENNLQELLPDIQLQLERLKKDKETTL